MGELLMNAWRLPRLEPLAGQAEPQLLVVEDESPTGPRLKFYSRVADVEFWTALWRAHRGACYSREEKGHLPHQLQGLFDTYVPRNARVLEAGCGLGRFTVAAAARGRRSEGLDWSAETIEWLRRRLPSIPWHAADARHIAADDGAFDAVYSPGVCEHFEEGPEAVLSETRRVLRPGGIALISTPSFNGWLRRRARRTALPAPPAGIGFYQYAFTPRGMATLLERLGFEVLEIRPYAVLDTFVRHSGWRVPGALGGIAALSMDYLPLVRQWGSTCLWVARKC